MTKSDFESILASHLSLVQSGEIDEVLVVSKKPVTSPAANTYLEKTKVIRHQTFSSLLESLLDFTGFLEAFRLDHLQGGLEEYYISPSSNVSLSLEDWLLEWMASADNRPVAVIASYGMGKTSLASHLTHKLIVNHKADPTQRIPILIKLGGLSQEQSLTGLLGTTLTAGIRSVYNYNFQVFEKLNRQGRFVIFLDGFDEMKHMMNYADFSRNFEELNRLSAGNSKVVLLGRPSAFLSDDEHKIALRGAGVLRKISARRASSIKYKEVNILPFNEGQVERFVKQYILHRTSREEIEFSEELLQRRFEDIDSLRDSGLLSRPVHTRMFVDIAINPENNLSDISRFELYDGFIDDLIDREVKKPGRGEGFNDIDRKHFLCDLAWYLWIDEDADQLGCRLSELPDTLFRDYKPVDTELEAAKRELLSGAFLEKKEPDFFFFAHRSFQEFLVSEYISIHGSLVSTISKEFLMDIIQRALTPEVMEFLIDGRRDILSNLASAISAQSLQIDFRDLSKLFDSNYYVEQAHNKREREIEDFDVLALSWEFMDRDSRRDPKEFVNYIHARTGERPGLVLASTYYVSCLAEQTGMPFSWYGSISFALLLTGNVLRARAARADALSAKPFELDRSGIGSVIDKIVRVIESPDGTRNIGLSPFDLFEAGRRAASNVLRDDDDILEDGEITLFSPDDLLQYIDDDLRPLAVKELQRMVTKISEMRRS